MTKGPQESLSPQYFQQTQNLILLAEEKGASALVGSPPRISGGPGTRSPRTPVLQDLLQGAQKLVQLLVVHLVQQIFPLSRPGVEHELQSNRGLRHALNLVARQGVLESSGASVGCGWVCACGEQETGKLALGSLPEASNRSQGLP